MRPIASPPIASLQCLRAFAALLVVVGHCQSEAAIAALKRGLPFAPLSVLPWGAGVDLFFAISGFIMVVASRPLFAAPGAAAAFAGRRLKRIVPLYWACTTLYVLIQFATRKPVAGVVASYLFWPIDTFGDGVPRPIFTLGWTLNYEMAFYALFALALPLPRRGAVALVAALLLAAVAAGQLATGQACDPPAGPLWFWTRPIVLEFAAGMAVGAAWCEGWRLPGAARLALAAVALATWALDPMGSAHQALTWITPNDGWRLACWGGPAVALLAAAVLAREPAPGSPALEEASASVPTGLGTPSRATKMLSMLGDASYALYLVHPFVVGTLMRAWTLTGWAQRVGYAPFVALSLVASIAAAFAVHRWIERPVADALARWPARRPLQPGGFIPRFDRPRTP